jgi:Alpha/beta hydrolase
MQLRHISIAQLIAETGGNPWAINKSLQSGRPAQISDLAQAFHHAGRYTTESSAAFDEARRRFAASWNHETGDLPINGSAEVRRTARSLDAQSIQLPNIGRSLHNIADALAGVQRTGAVLISTLETELPHLDTQLGEALDLEEDDHLISALEQQAVDHTRSALDQLMSMRSGYSDYLQNSLATLHADEFGRTNPPEPLAIPPAHTSPEDVRNWWDSLDQDQKDELIAQHPPELGNLNGISAVVRDTVNRAVLNDDIDRAEKSAELSPTDAKRYRNAVRTRDGLKYDTESGGPNQRPVMLWAYDPVAFNGRGKAAIAIGNPDYARNTALLVPGNGSSVAQGWLTGHADAINLYDQSLAADPDGHYTSVIAWMGFETPHGASDLRVSEPGLARTGGALLAADVNGLWVTHNSLTPQHITVVGHSYGSTTVADAFARNNMRANDAILLGCPGTDLAHGAADFHLDGGHVYVGSASTDPITWIGESSGVPVEWLKGRLGGSGIHLPPDAGLGRDPAGDSYGSIRFRAEVPDSESANERHHSHYYMMGSEALRAMTDIVSGHSERLATDGLLADGRRQPHVGSLRIPGLPAFVDPEGHRPRNSVLDNHQYPGYDRP